MLCLIRLLLQGALDGTMAMPTTRSIKIPDTAACNRWPLALVLAIAFSLSNLGCQAGTVANFPSKKEEVAVYGYEIVHVFPHDRDAFTQGS